MGKSIYINCKKVYETGTKYKNIAEEIRQKKRYLEEIVNNINGIWKGTDSAIFQASFSKHIYELNDIISFLEDKSMILKTSALEHSNIDSNFTTKMKKR